MKQISVKGLTIVAIFLIWGATIDVSFFAGRESMGKKNKMPSMIEIGWGLRIPNEGIGTIRGIEMSADTIYFTPDTYIECRRHDGSLIGVLKASDKNYKQ